MSFYVSGEAPFDILCELDSLALLKYLFSTGFRIPGTDLHMFSCVFLVLDGLAGSLAGWLTGLAGCLAGYFGCDCLVDSLSVLSSAPGG